MEEKQISIELCGLTLWVTVSHEDGYIGEVLAVRASQRGEIISCDTATFLEALEDTLQKALEDVLLSDRLAYEDHLYEVAREEGKL